MHFVEVFSIWLKYINARKGKLQGKQKLLLRNLDTGFSWFPCVYKQMLRWFATFQVATTCISCSPTDLNLVVSNFMFSLHVKYPLPAGNNPIAVNKYYYIIFIIIIIIIIIITIIIIIILYLSWSWATC